MVICRVLGGLGNQMFQYAAARALSLSQNAPLLLDLTEFNRYSLHQGYELQRVFSLDAREATPEEVRRILGWRAGAIIRRVLKHRTLSTLRGPSLVVEPHFHFWSGLATTPSPAYMMGYWQSEKYFGEHAPQLRADFRFRHPLQGANAQMASDMTACSSVSLHIRRGDYVTHKATTKVMALCTIDYYREAVRQIERQVTDPVFYIFTDDPDWVRAAIDFLPKSVLVDQNRGAESYRDMQLMSTCRHHIVANSSFSWWGAWLNPNPDKLVIAPKTWFRNELNDKDLIPTKWIRV